MSGSDILPIIERCSSVRVLCAGDVMLDRFVYGEVTRISPEAPIPVVSVRDEQSMLGGAGNAARNVSSLGASVDFITVVGQDAAGREIARELNALPGCTPRIVRDPARATSLKIRYLSHQQQILRVDSESTEPLSASCFSQVAGAFRSALPGAGIVLLTDYAKGVLSGDNASSLIALGRASGKPVFVDPKGQDFSRYRGATLVKPNLSELRDASRMPVNTPGETEAAARSLLDATGIEALLITRGAAGMMLVRRNAPVFEVAGSAREVFDVSGAGDTAAAALAVAFAAGARLEDAVRVANIAAGLVVSKLGTATVTREQLAWELQDSRDPASGGRIHDFDAAIDQILKWRRAGMRVHTLAGRFDQPQSELFELLRDARSQCDKLALAVVSNSPAPCSAAASPVCELLSALVWVDLVTPCSWDNVARFAGDTPSAR